MKKIKKVIGILLVMVLIVLAGAIMIFRNEIRTLASFKKVEDVRRLYIRMKKVILFMEEILILPTRLRCRYLHIRKMLTLRCLL